MWKPDSNREEDMSQLWKALGFKRKVLRKLWDKSLIAIVAAAASYLILPKWNSR
ncbi:MAG TPA: hypothetical protein VED17_02580 [Nitrososphaerales archaeon]|nr:hypothetical protein [Nitrososphaerales archaeon]